MKYWSNDHLHTAGRSRHSQQNNDPTITCILQEGVDTPSRNNDPTITCILQEGVNTPGKINDPTITCMLQEGVDTPSRDNDPTITCILQEGVDTPSRTLLRTKHIVPSPTNVVRDCNPGRTLSVIASHPTDVGRSRKTCVCAYYDRQRPAHTPWDQKRLLVPPQTWQ